MAADFPLKITIGAVDRLTQPLVLVERKIKSIFAPVTLLSDRLSSLSKTAGVEKVGKAFGGVWRGARDLGGEISRLGLKLAGLGAAGAAALKFTVFDFAEAGDSVAKTAQRLGVGVEWLQEWRFAAARANVETGAFDSGVEKLSRGLGEASFGKGEAQVALRALGVSLRGARGELRSTEDILPELADKLGKLTSETQRNALAQKLFGRGGLVMLQLLLEGTDAIEEARKEARRFGVVIGEESTRAADDFGDRMLDLQTVARGLRFAIGRELMPEVTSIAREFTDWLVGKLPLVRQWSKEFAAELPGRLRALKAQFAELGQELAPVIRFGKGLVERFGAVKVVGVALGLVLGGPLLVSVTTLAAAILKLSALMLATPFGLVTTLAIGLGAAGGYLLTRWEPVRRFFGKFFPSLLGGFEDVKKATESVPLAPTQGATRSFRAGAYGPPVVDTFLSRRRLGIPLPDAAIRMPAPAAPLLAPRGTAAETAPSGRSFLDELRAMSKTPGELALMSKEELRAHRERVRGGEARVTVDFQNMPKGVRVRAENNGVDLETMMGFSMQTP